MLLLGHILHIFPVKEEFLIYAMALNYGIEVLYKTNIINTIVLFTYNFSFIVRVGTFLCLDKTKKNV